MRLARILTAALTATLALSGCASGSPSAATEGAPLTVGLTYTPNVQFAPFYVAEELGYFTDAGLEVTLRHHGESEDLFGALEQGTEQFVYAGGDEIVQAVASGTALESIATLYQRYPAVVIVPESSPIKTLDDLRGHTVGTPGPYGETYFALLAALHRSGLSEQDVSVQNIGYTQQAALVGGKVDAVMGFANNDAVQFAQAGFPVRTIDAVDPASPTLVGPALAASTEVVSARGADVTKLLGALTKALEFIHGNLDQAVEIAAKYVPTLTTDEARADALATLQATMSLVMPDGTLTLTNDPTTWASMATFMQEAGLISTAVDPTTAYTNELLP